jgi:hypothetical protein
LSIHREPFMVWPGETARTAHVRLHELTPDGPHQQVIHWAGLGWGRSLDEMPRSDILLHFENLYYRRIPFGPWLRQWRHARLWIRPTIIAPLKILAKRTLSKVHGMVGG